MPPATHRVRLRRLARVQLRVLRARHVQRHPSKQPSPPSSPLALLLARVARGDLGLERERLEVVDLVALPQGSGGVEPGLADHVVCTTVVVVEVQDAAVLACGVVLVVINEVVFAVAC